MILKTPRFLLLFLFFFLSSSVAQAHILELGILSAENLKNLSNHFPTYDFRKIGLEQVDEVLRYLQIENGFDYLQVIELDNGHLKLLTKTTDKIGFVRFMGLRSFSDSEVRGTFGLDSSSLFSSRTLSDAVDRLQNFYRRRAYLRAEFDVETIQDSLGRHDLNVKILENQQTHIDTVNFFSPNSNLNAGLKRQFRRYHDAYTDINISLLQSQIKEFLVKDRYLRASISGPESSFSADDSKVDLNFTIENPVSYQFDFVGTKEITSHTLESSALNLGEFYSTNPNVGPELANRVRSFYLQRGFARAEVSSEEVAGKKDFIRKVTFSIDEGPKIKIAKFVLMGKYSREPGYYIDFIRTHSSPLVRDLYYNKEDVDMGIENLISDLRNQGYLMAKFSSLMRIQYNKEKNQVSVYLSLDEGPQTQVEQLVFTGNRSFTREQLLKVTGMPEKGALKLIELEKAIERLKKYYLDNGFIEMSLINEKEDLIVYNESNTKADVNFNISEGPQVRVAEVLVEGNTFSQKKLVTLELEMEPGDIVTPTKIEESVARIQRTGYFSSVEIKTLEEKTSVSNRTLLVKVTERDPGLFKFGPGVTNERELTLRGFTGIAYRNLFGTGRGVSARIDGKYNVADIKYPEYKITLGYVEPYLLDTRVRGRVNVTRDVSVTDYESRKVTETHQTIYSLEKDFTSHILGIWDVLSFAAYYDFGIDASKGVSEQKIDIGSTGISLNFDFSDSLFLPTHGYRTNINTEYGSPALTSSPGIEYIKSQAAFTHYQPFLGAKLIFANQIKAGYLKSLKSGVGEGVPFDKKGFVLGGRSTVRGFEAGTTEVFPNRSMLGTDNYLMSTSTEMFLIKSELRFPVYGNIGGTVFYDGGAVSIEGLDFQDQYRDAAGFGINVATPVGPVNLELGFKLDQKQGESPWRFHLSVGYF